MPKDIIAQLMKATDEHMLNTIDGNKREFSLIRTGRANPAILDRVLVEYYGERVPIKQVGTISAPEPRLLMISVWDKTMVKPIVNAVTSSDLGLNPVPRATSSACPFLSSPQSAAKSSPRWSLRSPRRAKSPSAMPAGRRSRSCAP